MLDASLLQKTANRFFGHRHALFVGRQNADVELVDRDLGLWCLGVQHRQAADVVDVPVRDDDPSQIGQRHALAELGAHFLQALEQLLIGVPHAAAGVDDRRRRVAQQQINVSHQARKRIARDAIDAHAGIALEATDLGQWWRLGRHGARITGLRARTFLVDGGSSRPRSRARKG